MPTPVIHARAALPPAHVEAGIEAPQVEPEVAPRARWRSDGSPAGPARPGPARRHALAAGTPWRHGRPRAHHQAVTFAPAHVGFATGSALRQRAGLLASVELSRTMVGRRGPRLDAVVYL